MKNTFKKLKNYLLNLIFPKHIKCIFCGDELNEHSKLDTCIKCQNSLPLISTCCIRCGLPVPYDFVGVCQQCKQQNYSFETARSVFSYTNNVMALIKKVKFRSKKVFIPKMAEYMLSSFNEWNIKIDLITFVPMWPKSEKERGFNQSKLLAEELSKLSGIPVTYCANKIKNTLNQRDLSFQKRKENILDAFNVNKENKAEIKNKTILIVDDVFTTGATTSELSKTLKQSGAKACYVLTFAHTLLKH